MECSSKIVNRDEQIKNTKNCIGLVSRIDSDVGPLPDSKQANRVLKYVLKCLGPQAHVRVISIHQLFKSADDSDGTTKILHLWNREIFT